MSDEELLQAIAAARDKKAFAELFTRYAGRLRGYFARHLRSPAEAEELVQEIMMTLWGRADTFDAVKASACTWIFRIARNRMIDRLRVPSRLEPSSDDPLFEPESPEEGTDNQLAAFQSAALVRKALACLPKEQLEVVQDVYFGRISVVELAQQSGVPIGTLKSRLRLGLAKLRQELAAQRGDLP